MALGAYKIRKSGVLSFRYTVVRIGIRGGVTPIVTYRDETSATKLVDLLKAQAPYEFGG